MEPSACRDPPLRGGAERLRKGGGGYGEGVSATSGFVVSGVALLVGVAALMIGEGLRREKGGQRAGLDIVGAVLCLGGVVWLLLSVAAYGGD